MSESYITAETAAPLRGERSNSIQGTPQTGVRFTPLRSETVVRSCASSTDGEVSPLVPVRRRNS